MRQRRSLIEKQHPHFSIREQCRLLQLAASTYYAAPQPVDALDLELMRLMDRQYLETPFYGVERMTWVLQQQGYHVNPKRVRRLMRLMALEAIYPKPRTSIGSGLQGRYPYLLRGLTISGPDHVWAADITYIPMERGFCYLCAVMDWSSRCVLAWELSNTMDALFCLDALESALAAGRKPAIFNTDQGAQFTCQEFVDRLLHNGIRPSWDGKGRWVDNVFVERLWRSVKQECVYRCAWRSPQEARRGLAEYFTFYNHWRPHTSLDKVPPAAVYFKSTQTRLEPAGVLFNSPGFGRNMASAPPQS